VTKGDRELDQVQIAMHGVALAVPKGHPLIKFKKVRLRDMVDASFIWFLRQESPAFYDRMMNECYRGGLKSRRIIQEARNEATILSQLSHAMGVGFVNGTARWRCPEGVVILSVTDLKMPLPLALVWRKDNLSPLPSQFGADMRSLPDVSGVAPKRGCS
jgi:DNA-binding transcriptional LysR family regulator